MNLLEILSKVPPEAWDGIGRTIGAIAEGNVDKAEREARVTAETVAAKRTIDAAYEAGAKERG